jgi:hypothetical protein
MIQRGVTQEGVIQKRVYVLMEIKVWNKHLNYVRYQVFNVMHYHRLKIILILMNNRS